jgi:hypothetical protein
VFTVAGRNLLAGSLEEGVWIRPLDEMTGISGESPDSAPHGFTLEQNYPNPFNPATEIRFVLPAPGWVEMEIFDTTGRKVATPASRFFDSGSHGVTWDASDRPSGIYLCRLQAGGFSKTVRMALMR